MLLSLTCCQTWSTSQTNHRSCFFFINSRTKWMNEQQWSFYIRQTKVIMQVKQLGKKRNLILISQVWFKKQTNKQKKHAYATFRASNLNISLINFWQRLWVWNLWFTLQSGSLQRSVTGGKDSNKKVIYSYKSGKDTSVNILRLVNINNTHSSEHIPTPTLIIPLVPWKLKFASSPGQVSYLSKTKTTNSNF